MSCIVAGCGAGSPHYGDIFECELDEKIELTPDEVGKLVCALASKLSTQFFSHVVYNDHGVIAIRQRGGKFELFGARASERTWQPLNGEWIDNDRLTILSAGWQFEMGKMEEKGNFWINRELAHKWEGSRPVRNRRASNPHPRQGIFEMGER